MYTYIAILRGINVSGHKKVIMSDLKLIFENLEFYDVETYIQSGNVIFNIKTKFTNTKLSKYIEKELENQFGFQVPVIIRSLQELQNIVAINPFKQQDIDNLYITFLSNAPNPTQIEKLNEINYLPDNFEIIDKDIFLSVVSYGNTKLSNNFF
jgi:uncharacterized protein (DUF1697 family)